MPEQNYANHTRYDPLLHFFLMPLCLTCFVASIVHVVHSRTPFDVLLVPVTFALLLSSLKGRMYAVKNQDRIIRLEEDLRMRRLGVDPSSLSTPQCVALRFAPDDELPALAARAAVQNSTPKQIKEAVARWRPDYHRI